MCPVVYLTDGNDDGSSIGQSASEKISFYGITPVVQATLVNATLETTVAISTTTAKWGFATSTQANGVIALLNEIRAKLVALGLVA